MPMTSPSLSQVLQAVYPVGSLYLEITGTNPATTFGFGTWVAWGGGELPVGFQAGDVNFGTVEATGGAKTATIAQANLPNISTGAGTSHNHTQNSHDHAGTNYAANVAAGSNYTACTTPGSGVGNGWRVGSTTPTNNAEAAHTHSLGGSGTPVSILPPYIVCYIWKRTA